MTSWGSFLAVNDIHDIRVELGWRSACLGRFSMSPGKHRYTQKKRRSYSATQSHPHSWLQTVNWPPLARPLPPSPASSASIHLLCCAFGLQNIESSISPDTHHGIRTSCLPTVEVFPRTAFPPYLYSFTWSLKPGL